MKQLLEALHQSKANNVGSQSAIVGMVQEWKGMGQNLVGSLENWVADIEKREHSLISVRESLEEKLKDLEERERVFERRRGDMVLKEWELCPLLKDFSKGVELKEKKLDEQLKLVNEHIKNLEVDQNELQGLKQQQCEKVKKVEEKEREIESIRRSLETREIKVERREKELELDHEKKLKMLQRERLKQVEEKEEDIDSLRGSMEKRLRGVEQKEKEFNELHEQKLKHFEERERDIDLLRGSLEQREKESIEFHAQNLKQIEETEKENDLMQKSLKKRLREVEQREKELNVFQDKKLREVVLKEELLSNKREEFVEEVKSANKKFINWGKTGRVLIKRLETTLSMLEGVKTAVDAKVQEIESWEGAAREALAANVKEAELIHEQLEKRYEELDKLLKERRVCQESNVQNVELKDQHPSVIREELFKEIKLRDEKITEQQMLGHQLLGRLEELTAKKLNEMESLQLTLNVTSETFCAKVSDSNGELVDMHLHELKRREEEFHLYQVKRERELELEEKKLSLIFEGFSQEVKCREEKFAEQEKLFCDLLRRSEAAQSKLVDTNKMISKRFKELSSKEKELGSIKARYEKKTKELEFKMREWEKGIKAKEDAIVSKDKTHELQSPIAAFDYYLETEQEAMDVKRLEMVINYPFKDWKLMGDDVNKIFLMSPDPAKLVLTAIEGFWTPQFMEGDRESNMRRTRVLLLDQLTRMSPNIQSCVREAAIGLANEWKSKLRAGDENELQVLEFLYLLAAYKLHSLFDKDELMSFLKVVAQHKQTPELCRILDLKDKMEAFVRNLIIEKQFLLASTYIYECGLEKWFPQQGVLNFYVKHVTNLGNVKRKKEQNSSEAQAKAILTEINDLRAAIEHIVKNGLESHYSPDILMEKIHQLETERASLKNGSASSLGKRSSQLQDKAAIDGALVANARLPELGSEEGTTQFGRTSQNPQGTPRKRCRPQNFHESQLQEDMKTKPFHPTEVANQGLGRNPNGSRKRCKASNRDFWHHESSYGNHRPRR